MEHTEVAVIKIKADNCKYDFKNEVISFENCNDSYIKISTPFYSYIYEQIEKMREEQDIKTVSAEPQTKLTI